MQGSDHLQPEIERLRNALHCGASITVTMRNYRKDGMLFWNELTLTPHKDVDGVIVYYVGLIRDVTKAKKNATDKIRAFLPVSRTDHLGLETDVEVKAA